MVLRKILVAIAGKPNLTKKPRRIGELGAQHLLIRKRGFTAATLRVRPAFDASAEALQTAP